MITADNLVSHELIGLKTEITQSSNKQVIGLNGTIMDETKSMFILNTKNGIKRISKMNNTWKFLVNNVEKEINGSSITKRPFDRLGLKIE